MASNRNIITRLLPIKTPILLFYQTVKINKRILKNTQ